MNETPPNDDLTPVPMFHFHMVQAEVVFDSDQGIRSHRLQMPTKSDTQNFSGRRLTVLQNAAAHQVRQLIETEKFNVLEVYIHALIPLGYMSDFEFYGAAPPEDLIPEVAAPATPAEDNVLPFPTP